MKELENQYHLFEAVAAVIVVARNMAYRSNNSLMLHMYWDIGRPIVEDEQGGKQKAQYRKAVLKNLSLRLNLEFGKGYDESNLSNMRQFYIAFQKRDALRHELSWTQYRIISRIENEAYRIQNEKLFASKYRLYLPKEEELKQWIEQDRINFELDHEN